MKPKTANLVQARGAGRPAWFDAFLADRGTRKPSRHTVAAYCADFDAIARLLLTRSAAESSVHLNDIADEPLGTAFAAYAEKHKAATVRRCWSSWNVLCTYLLTTERISKNPMTKVGRPKIEKTLPKSLPREQFRNS